MSDELIVQQEEARVEMGHEEVVFVTKDGKRHVISMVNILEKGTTDQALAYAQLVLAQATIHQISGLARAMNELASALKSIIPPEGERKDPQDVINSSITTVIGALKNAGVPVPNLPPGVLDGNRSKSK